MYMRLGENIATPAYGPPGGSDPRLTPVQQPSLVQNILTAWGTFTQIQNQNKLAKENLERARQNQPPLTYTDVPGLVPTVQVQAGLDAQNAALVKWVLIGGGALALVFLLKR